MLKKFKYKEITWLDLESPTSEELAQIGQEWSIHPLVIQELAQASHRTKVDLYNDYLYLILHFPDISGEHDHQEVDFVIGKNFIITAHYEPLNAVHDFSKIFETDFEWKKGAEKIHAGFLFFYLMREMYASLEDGLRYANDKLKKVEKEVFAGHEREMVQTLSAINRELLDYRWSLKAHKEVLASLEIAGPEIFGNKFTYFLKAIIGEQEKLWDMLENLRETFTDLSDTNDSLLAIKTNNIIRALTVAAFVFLPLTVVPQIFGMNTSFMPFRTHPYDFVLVMALMALSSAFLYLLARLKRWF